MTDPELQPGEPMDQLRAEAAAWFARMRGEDSAQHQAAFEDWLKLGASHRAAYNRIGAVFAAAKVLKDEPRPVARRWRAGVLVGLAAVLLIAPLALRNNQVRHAPPGSSPPTVTADRAIRSRPLATGGRVILDVDAKLTANVAGDPALLRLERGRVRFLPEPARPAPRVLAGAFAVQSAGGSFDLWLRPDGSLDADTWAGGVDVRPAVLIVPAGARRVVHLSAGQHVRFAASGGVAERSHGGESDWPTGVLEYRATPLAEVLGEANRYSAIKIVLAEPSLGDRRVFGRFRVDDPLILARRLAAALSLVVDPRQPGEIILSSSAK